MRTDTVLPPGDELNTLTGDPISLAATLEVTRSLTDAYRPPSGLRSPCFADCCGYSFEDARAPSFEAQIVHGPLEKFDAWHLPGPETVTTRAIIELVGSEVGRNVTVLGTTFDPVTGA